MKAISLWQPYASLIAIGAKPYETRSFGPPPARIGQTIAIHAAKKVDRDIFDFVEEMFEGRHHQGGKDLEEKLRAHVKAMPADVMAAFGKYTMPVGCIVCTARLDAAFQLGECADGTSAPAAKVVRRLISRPMPDCFTVKYDDFGDYSEGRWAWLLRDVKPLANPIPWKGKQGWFDVPDQELLAAA